jgi:hypothetical protein
MGRALDLRRIDFGSTPPTPPETAHGRRYPSAAGRPAGVTDPNTGKDFVSTKALKNLQADDGDVSFDVELGYPAKSQIPALRKALIAAAKACPAWRTSR